MALTSGQKQLAAMVAKKNGDPDYMIRLSEDAEFAMVEIAAALPSLKEELEKEKLSHETHIGDLTTRLSKIYTLLSSIEEIQNVNS